jgi:hypothetical protein
VRPLPQNGALAERDLRMKMASRRGGDEKSARVWDVRTARVRSTDPEGRRVFGFNDASVDGAFATKRRRFEGGKIGPVSTRSWISGETRLARLVLRSLGLCACDEWLGTVRSANDEFGAGKVFGLARDGRRVTIVRSERVGPSRPVADRSDSSPCRLIVKHERGHEYEQQMVSGVCDGFEYERICFLHGNRG